MINTSDYGLVRYPCTVVILNATKNCCDHVAHLIVLVSAIAEMCDTGQAAAVGLSTANRQGLRSHKAGSGRGGRKLKGAGKKGKHAGAAQPGAAGADFDLEVCYWLSEIRLGSRVCLGSGSCLLCTFSKILRNIGFPEFAS